MYDNSDSSHQPAGSHHPPDSVGGFSLQGGELRLPYEAPVGGAGVERPAGWLGPNRPSKGDPNHHPVYCRSDRGLTILHGFSRGLSNTPQGSVLG